MCPVISHPSWWRQKHCIVIQGLCHKAFIKVVINLPLLCACVCVLMLIHSFQPERSSHSPVKSNEGHHL